MNQRKMPSLSDKRSPQEIAAEIDEAKSIISNDIKELGEKLSPENLRAEAKNVLHNAKEDMKDSLRGAKNTALSTLRNAKDHAMESAIETYDEVSYQARRAGAATADFASTNAVPLALIGLGAGWLVMSLRKQRRLREERYLASSFDYEREREYLGRGVRREYGYRGDVEYGPDYEYGSDFGQPEFARDTSGEGQSALERGKERVGDMASRGKEQVEDLASRGRERAGEIASRAKEGAREVRGRLQERASALGHRVSDFGHDARVRFERAQHRTRDFAHENPFALAGLAIAAGVGIGLALPASTTEKRLLGPTRGRLMSEARGYLGEARETASRTAQAAREAVDEVKSSISQPTAPQ